MGKAGRRVLGEPWVWWGLSDRKVVESLCYQDAHGPCKRESSSGASGLSSALSITLGPPRPRTPLPVEAASPSGSLGGPP